MKKKSIYLINIGTEIVEFPSVEAFEEWVSLGTNRFKVSGDLQEIPLDVEEYPSYKFLCEHLENENCSLYLGDKDTPLLHDVSIEYVEAYLRGVMLIAGDMYEGTEHEYPEDSQKDNTGFNTDDLPDGGF